MKMLGILLRVTIITLVLAIIFHAVKFDLGVLFIFIAWFFIALILMMLSCEDE